MVRRQAEKEERARVPPSELFRGPGYSAWDHEGFPTMDKDGQTLSKAATKRLQKELAKHREAFEKLQQLPASSTGSAP